MAIRYGGRPGIANDARLRPQVSRIFLFFSKTLQITACSGDLLYSDVFLQKHWKSQLASIVYFIRFFFQRQHRHRDEVLRRRPAHNHL